VPESQGRPLGDEAFVRVAEQENVRLAEVLDERVQEMDVRGEAAGRLDDPVPTGSG